MTISACTTALKMKIFAMSWLIKAMTRTQFEAVLKHLGKSLLFHIAKIEKIERASMDYDIKPEILSKGSSEE